MHTDPFKTTTLDDIIFEHRNKSYGAYLLRKSYPRNFAKAFVFGMLLFAFFLMILYRISVTVINQFTSKQVIGPIHLNQLPRVIPQTVEPVRAVRLLSKSVFSIPKIAPDAEVTEETNLPQPNAANGVATSPVDSSAVTGSGENGTSPTTATVSDKPYVSAEEMPAYPGGNEAMLKFIGKNIRYPEEAKSNRIEGTVILKFVVDEAGKIGDIEVLRDPGGGCAEEAIRVLKAMPDWKPGKQNGIPVKVYFVLPITFHLDD